ncbi:hypothetical protein JCM3765_002399 [Sporobolomyces pararoseus]
MSKKRPIETIVLSDSDSDDDDQDEPRRKLSRPPPHITTGASNERVRLPSEEDPEFQAAIRASLEEQNEVINVNQQQLPPPPPSPQLQREQQGQIAETSSSSSLLGGLDRAEMEKARLERIAKLHLESSSYSKPRTTTSNTSSSNGRSRIATLSDLSSSSSSTSGSSAFTSAPFSPSSPSSEQRFFSGQIRRVYNKYDPSPPPSDVSSFPSLIGSPSTLVGSIMSSYVWDLSWVLNHFPSNLCRDVPILLIMPRPKGDDEKESFTKISGKWDFEGMGIDSNLREVYRSIPRTSQEVQYGCMHTKFLVFFHDDYCRIVIPSANAIEYDWSLIDNAFYVQDFPLLKQEPSKDSSPWDNPTLNQFSSNFITVVNKLGANKAFLSLFKPFDFSKSSEIRLVHSIQGKYTTPESFDKGGGLASLSKSVSSLKFHHSEGNNNNWEVEVTGSSISRYPPTWLIQFLSACQGLHPTSYFTHSILRPNSKTSPLYPFKPTPPPRGQSYDFSKLPLKIIFPTREEILSSYGGVEGGGTIFFPRARWNERSFPKSLLYKGKSKRYRTPAHTKMILASHKVENIKEGSNNGTIYEGYIYVGSHNFTTSAWGQLQDGQSGVKQLLVNNYELGVILPIKGCQTQQEFEQKVNGLVSFRRDPLEKFGPNDLPWMQDDFPEVYKKDGPTRPGGSRE